MRYAYRLTKQLIVRLRLAFHRLRLGASGPGLDIARGAVLESAERVHLGDCVHLGRYSIVRANGEDPCRLDVGSRVSIMDHVLLNCNGGDIRIGDDTWIGPSCMLYGNAGITIGSHVMVAGHTSISTVSHHYESLELPMCQQALDCAPICIGDDVWIGMNVSILKGVSIGRGCIVGAGSVVTRDLPDYSISVGVPARVIGTRKQPVQEAA